MTDSAALYRAIIANPGDDTPRLVYADWCEENGEQERAAFIRAGIAINGNRYKCTSGYPASASTPRQLPKRFEDIPSVALFAHFTVAPAIPGIAWTVRRGFAEGVTLTADLWARMADELIAGYPLQSVELTTYPQVVIDPSNSHISIRGYERFVDPPQYTAHPGHILHALWPSIPLAGWKMPEADHYPETPTGGHDLSRQPLQPAYPPRRPRRG